MYIVYWKYNWINKLIQPYLNVTVLATDNTFNLNLSCR